MPRRSKHPGIWIERRERGDGPTWYARGPLLRGSINLTREYAIHTKAAAEAWAIRHSEIARLRRSGLGPAISIGEAVAAYLAELDLKLDAGEIAVNTRKGYAMVARRVEAELGASRLTTTLTRADLFELRAKLRGRTPATTQTMLSRTRSIVEDWRQQGLTPLVDRDAIFDGLRVKLRNPRPRPRCLSRAEIAALDATIPPDPRPRYLWLPRFLLLTGMRPSEALQLQRRDVELGVRRIQLPAHKAKGGSWRSIVLSVCPSVEDWLHDYVQELPEPDSPLFPFGYDTSRHLFVASRHGKPRAARVAVPGFTWRWLRSTCASYLHGAEGIRLTHTDKAKQLGHTIRIAERRYIDRLFDIPDEASTLEEAMGLTDVPERGGRIHKLGS